MAWELELVAEKNYELNKYPFIILIFNFLNIKFCSSKNVISEDRARNSLQERGNRGENYLRAN